MRSRALSGFNDPIDGALGSTVNVRGPSPRSGRPAQLHDIGIARNENAITRLHARNSIKQTAIGICQKADQFAKRAIIVRRDVGQAG